MIHVVLVAAASRGMTFSSTSFSIFQMGFLKRRSHRRKRNWKMEKPALLFVKNKNRRHQRRTLLSLPETSLGLSEKANSAAFRLFVRRKIPTSGDGKPCRAGGGSAGEAVFPHSSSNQGENKASTGRVRVRPVLSPSSA